MNVAYNFIANFKGISMKLIVVLKSYAALF